MSTIHLAMVRCSYLDVLLFKDYITTVDSLYILMKNVYITIGPRHLVVTDKGVAGEYLDIEKAKQNLLSIDSGSRIIATVDSMGVLNTNSKYIDNILQHMNIPAVEGGQLYKLLNFGEEYLQSLESMHKSI